MIVNKHTHTITKITQLYTTRSYYYICNIITIKFYYCVVKGTIKLFVKHIDLLSDLEITK